MKDPAFLFYTSDFVNGTKDMTNEEVGIYIRLLCRQHDKKSIKAKIFEETVPLDSEIYEKFVKDEEGNYYNVRLRTEVEKRIAYSQSRRDNRLKNKGKEVSSDKSYDNDMNNTSKTYDKHMENENEIENINEDILKKGMSDLENEFEVFRKMYEGSKRGFKTEWENFKKKHKDYKDVVPKLVEAYRNLIAHRNELATRKEFVPQHKNLQTYLNGRFWEEEFDSQSKETPKEDLEELKKMEGYAELLHNSPIYRYEIENGKIRYVPKDYKG